MLLKIKFIHLNSFCMDLGKLADKGPKSTVGIIFRVPEPVQRFINPYKWKQEQSNSHFTVFDFYLQTNLWWPQVLTNEEWKIRVKVRNHKMMIYQISVGEAEVSV